MILLSKHRWRRQPTAHTRFWSQDRWKYELFGSLVCYCWNARQVVNCILQLLPVMLRFWQLWQVFKTFTKACKLISCTSSIISPTDRSQPRTAHNSTLYKPCTETYLQFGAALSLTANVITASAAFPLLAIPSLSFTCSIGAESI